MNKHTPAPWRLDHKSLYSAPIIFSDTRNIAKVLYHGGSEDQEVIANAHLIAAAPELLAATTRMLNWLEGRSDEIDIIDLALDARTAITKAKG